MGMIPDPRQIGDGTPIPIPGQIGEGEGDGDRGFRALCYMTHMGADLPAGDAGARPCGSIGRSIAPRLIRMASGAQPDAQAA